MVKRTSALLLLLAASCTPALHAPAGFAAPDSRPLIVANVVPVEGGSGDTVMIHGYGFTSAGDTTIAFGSATAVVVDVLDENRMEVVVPRGTGTVDVCITNSNGSWIALTGYSYGEPADSGVVTFCFPL